MHCGAGGSVVGSSVVGASVVGGSVVGASVVGASVVGVSVVGVVSGSVADDCVVVGSVAALCVVGGSVTGGSVAVTEGSVVAGAEEAAGVSSVVEDCKVGSCAEGAVSPVSVCGFSPKKNAAAKTQTITAAAIAAYCHFFILQGNGRASSPPVHGSPSPAGRDGCRRCRGSRPQ